LRRFFGLSLKELGSVKGVGDASSLFKKSQHFWII